MNTQNMSEQQEPSLSNNSTSEIDEEFPPPAAGTSGSIQCIKSVSLTSNNKMNLQDLTAKDDATTSLECNVKRIKNDEGTILEDASAEEGALPENFVFSNDLVLRHIFKMLNLEDLFSSRQVNRLWNLEATKVLFQKNYMCRIYISNDMVAACRFSFFKARFTFNEHFTISNAGSLRDLQDLVKNSLIFPCNRFVITDDPLSDGIKYFFRKFGHLVKSLWFEPKIGNIEHQLKTTVYDVLLLATTYLPNIETLEFEKTFKTSTPAPAEIEEAIECAAEMKKLHTLELYGDFPTHLLSLVLKKAKNLKNIYFDKYVISNDYKNGLEKLLKIQNAIPRLRNLSLMFTSDFLAIYEQVLTQTPRFSTIQYAGARTELYLELHRMGQILSAIFEQSSESLNDTLELRPLGDILGLTIPNFPNLKHLKIDFTSQSWNLCPPMLPLGVNLADKCPNVKTVELHFGGYCHTKGPGKILPHDLWGPFLSVRHLQVEFGERFVSDDWVTRLCSLFPNLTSVRFLNEISESALEYLRQRGIRIKPRASRLV